MSWNEGWSDEGPSDWDDLEFGEGDYVDYDKIARDKEKWQAEESQELETFWHLEQVKHDLGWDTDYEKRKSKARWDMFGPEDWDDCE